MEYRRLGRTGLKVSVLGVGGGYVSVLDIPEGTRVYRRAAELGINYFDGRYGWSSTMINPVIKGQRERFVVGTKTQDRTAEGAMKRIEEDLRELGTDYLDVFYLRTYNHDMLEQHFALGGSVEGVLKAKEQGKVRNLGLAGHSDLTALAKGVETGLIDCCIFPLNVVRREALEQLIPTLQKHDVGTVIMKPVAVGTIPASVALPWLANQPIHVMAPGIGSMEHLELNAKVMDRPQMALTAEEEAEVERWRQRLDNLDCRICDRVCQPVCAKKIPIDWILYHDVQFNVYRTFGAEGFFKAPLAPWFKASVAPYFARRISILQSCNRCGECEKVCPYHLPIMDMIENMLADELPFLEKLQAAGWTEQYKGAESPYAKGH